MYHNRKSLRLKNHDYTYGSYFVTICIGSTGRFLATNYSRTLTLTEIGRKADYYWREIPNHSLNVHIDEYVIMPDHIHAILHLDYVARTRLGEPFTSSAFHAFQKSVPNSLGVIINHYKSAVTRWCKANGFADFKWHRSFHENIINNKIELNRIKQYIRQNPNRKKMTHEKAA
jgi:REP element-mobilizing transposase RayT